MDVDSSLVFVGGGGAVIVVVVVVVMDILNHFTLKIIFLKTFGLLLPLLPTCLES